MNEVPIEAVALLAFYRDLFDIAASALRDSLLGWVVAMASIAGFVLIPRMWTAYSMMSLVLFFYGLDAAYDRFRAVFDVTQ